jgi:hypothetical protein
LPARPARHAARPQSSPSGTSRSSSEAPGRSPRPAPRSGCPFVSHCLAACRPLTGRRVEVDAVVAAAAAGAPGEPPPPESSCAPRRWPCAAALEPFCTAAAAFSSCSCPSARSTAPPPAGPWGPGRAA